MQQVAKRGSLNVFLEKLDVRNGCELEQEYSTKTENLKWKRIRSKMFVEALNVGI